MSYIAPMNSLSQFLTLHCSNFNNSPIITHTRIPCKELKIFGGSYQITEESLSLFYKLYFNYVFVNNNFEYLTEKQFGYIIGVDMDFKYIYEICERQHTADDIKNIIDAYMNEIKNILMIDTDTKINIFVMEKPNVNQVKNKSITKDGIHIIINIKMDFTLQQILRERMLIILPNILSHLPITNTWDLILDEGISKGTTNWQLYGSRKPDNEAYKLTYSYEYQLLNDGNYITSSNNFIINPDNFIQLSVQNPNNPSFELNPKIITLYNDKIKNLKPNNKISNIENITTNELNNDKQIELHKLSYFIEKGFANEIGIQKNHLDFCKIGYALNATFLENGLPLYMKLVEKYTDDYISKKEEYIQKYNTSLTKHKDITIGTIYFIFKQYNPELYKSIMTDYFKEFPINNIEISNESRLIIDKAIFSQTEYDIACVVREIMDGKYVCIDIKNKIIYQFIEHRWVKDTGHSLRNIISTTLFNIFNKIEDEIFLKIGEMNCEIQNNEDDSTLNKKREKIKQKHKVVQEICNKLKKTNDKNNIFRELLEILYDAEFMNKLDNIPYLYAFNNCVFDLRIGEKIQGKKEHYISITTGYDYIENYDTTGEKKLELIQLLNTIHKNIQIKDYYLTYLSTALYGEQIQKLVMATGTGGNGKTILNSLVLDMTGNYGHNLDASILQNKIQTGANPQIAGLHKKRFVLMSEPDKDRPILASAVCNIIGKKQIDARQLYSQDTKTELHNTTVLECNTKPCVNETGGAIGRRIEEIPFLLEAKDTTEWDLLTEEQQLSGDFTQINTYYISDDFRNKYKQILFEILLPYIKEFLNNNKQLGKLPNECAIRTKNYLAMNDDIYPWFELNYQQLNIEELGTPIDIPISLTEIYTKFSSSEAFTNLSKVNKRLFNRKNFLTKLNENLFLRKYVKIKDTKYNNKYIKSDSIVGWKEIEEEEEN